MSPSLLDHIRAQVHVGIDSMDPTVAARYTSEDVKFYDMTSNQAIVYNECIRPERQELLKAAIDLVRKQGLIVDKEKAVIDTFVRQSNVFVHQALTPLDCTIGKGDVSVSDGPSACAGITHLKE